MTNGHPLFRSSLGYYHLFNYRFWYSLVDIQGNISINHTMHNSAASNEDEYDVHQVDIWQCSSCIE